MIGLVTPASTAAGRLYGGFSGGFPGFEEIFEEFFGGFGGSAASAAGVMVRSQGRDLRYDLTIDFNQAVFGADIDIEVPQAAKPAR